MRRTLGDMRSVASSLSANRLYATESEESGSPKLVKICFPSEDTACACQSAARAAAVDCNSSRYC